MNVGPTRQSKPEVCIELGSAFRHKILVLLSVVNVIMSRLQLNSSYSTLKKSYLVLQNQILSLNFGLIWLQDYDPTIMMKIC